MCAGVDPSPRGNTPTLGSSGGEKTPQSGFNPGEIIAKSRIQAGPRARGNMPRAAFAHVLTRTS
jgi:hypothetical protein